MKKGDKVTDTLIDYEKLIDDAWKKYVEETMFDSDPTWLEPIPVMNMTTGEKSMGARQYHKEGFVFKCKTDSEFSQKWGLKIEERELDMMERWQLAELTPNMTEFDFANYMCDKFNVPTKLITISYNNEIIDVYE